MKCAPHSSGLARSRASLSRLHAQQKPMTDGQQARVARPLGAPSTLPMLDIDEMGSVAHCIAAMASESVVAVPGNVASEK